MDEKLSLLGHRNEDFQGAVAVSGFVSEKWTDVAVADICNHLVEIGQISQRS